MYINSGYLHHSLQDFKDKSRPLVVGSCGTYRLIHQPKLPTYRPRGRIDYQLLYVASGKGHFFFDDKEEIIEAGHMILYRPREMQRYVYYGTDQTEVYWVHFTGNNVKNILRKYGIVDGVHVIYSGVSMEYKHLYMNMIEELQLRKEDYEELLVYYFMQLLILLHRQILVKPHKKNPMIMDDMAQAVDYFRMHYNKQINIEKYAASKNISVSWFIQNFKQYTNTTPAQYIQNLRLSNAKSLLETTNYNVTEISNLVGYENPLYFSRFFRKQFGASPSQFRKQLRQNEENQMTEPEKK